MSDTRAPPSPPALTRQCSLTPQNQRVTGRGERCVVREGNGCNRSPPSPTTQPNSGKGNEAGRAAIIAAVKVSVMHHSHFVETRDSPFFIHDAKLPSLPKLQIEPRGEEEMDGANSDRPSLVSGTPTTDGGQGEEHLLPERIATAIDIKDTPVQVEVAANQAPTTSSAVERSMSVGGKRDDYLSWDEFFMATALLAAQRSKDPSTQADYSSFLRKILQRD